MATAIKTQNLNTVYGTLRGTDGRVLPNLKIAIYNVEMREWLPLGETTTGSRGTYEVQWEQKQLGDREHKSADIALKVFTAEKGTELFRSSMDEVRFNAGDREEINITLKQPVPTEVVEFDFLVREVTRLAGKVSIASLQEDGDNRDLTFLAKELEVLPAKLEHLVVAHRLGALTKIEPAFFYALLRKKSLLQSTFSEGKSTRLSIGLDVDDTVLLYDIALADPKLAEAHMKAAVSEKIVSAVAGKQVDVSLESLIRFRDKATAYYKKEHPQKVAQLLSEIVKGGEKGLLQPFFRGPQEKIASLEAMVATPDFSAATPDPKIVEALGKFFGNSSNLIPDILEEKKITRPEDIRRLARLNKKDWVRELSRLPTKVGSKALVSTFASSIVRNFEKEYPTVAFSAQLQREKKTLFRNQDKMVAFFSKNEDFDLLKNNIDVYFAEKKVSSKDTDAIGEELKSVQRVFKLAPNYSVVNALRAEKIESAQSIVSMGRARFVGEIAPKAGLGIAEAGEIFQKAEVKSTAAILLAGELQGSMGVVNIASFETQKLNLKLEMVSKDFPNLKSLFKTADACECTHCRSVYSPAAYLVELLHFLDKRSVTAGNAKSVLFSRRPDLGDIDLSCANANTPVKYIDLVCELLEEEIAPDKGIKFTGALSQGSDPLVGKISEKLLKTLLKAGLPVTADALIYATESVLDADALPHYLRDTKLVCKIENTGGDTYKVYRLRQTLATAAELDAAPEYVNTAAYEALQNKEYAFALPFNLPHVEVGAYLNRFDVKRHRLLAAFGSGDISLTPAIAGERLGLTPAEQELVTRPPVPNNDAAQQAFWNVPAGKVPDYMKQVDHFLDRTALAYAELEALLALPFIAGRKKLFIRHNDGSCDTAEKEIQGLDLEVLDRIHRFLRLQKKTGWKFSTLDAVVSGANLGGGKLDESCLIVAAQLDQIREQTGIPVAELVGCFGTLPHAIAQAETPIPLYQQVFGNKAQNGPVPEALLPENVDGSAQLTDYAGYVATSLRLKPADLELLLSLLPSAALDFSNLSFLYFASRLLKTLRLKAPEFVALTQLAEVNIAGSPRNALDFIAVFEALQDSPLKAEAVVYLLQHKAPDLDARALGAAKAAQILSDLKEGYAQLIAGNSSLFNPAFTAQEQLETLKNALLTAGRLTESNADEIAGFLEAEVLLAPEAKQFVADTLEGDLPKGAINDALDALAAIAADADKSSARLTLLNALLDALSERETDRAKRGFLEETLVRHFGVEAEVVAPVLAHAQLKQMAPGTDFVSAILANDFADPVSEGAYPEQYAALRLLHKMLPAIGAFGLSATELEWHFQNAAAPGWLEWDRIPFEAGHPKTDFSKYHSFTKALSYASRLAPVDNPLNADQPIHFYKVVEESLPAGTATKEAFLEALALLMAVDKAVLKAVDAQLFPTFATANYSNLRNWDRMEECITLLRKLGATVPQAVRYLNPVLTENEVADLRAALKLRYDESTWLQTLKEITDAIRPQKRDALVAYLLATNPGIRDKAALYEYLLVDVEMEACMPSSRIVQAHNSIQLFVQRCLMGLEPEAVADIEVDPSWGQWQWMKQYRVWEANRKVFLYPENWYDVTLTDDKTHLLEECINELQQNELTSDRAETALTTYLEKLDDIAFLEVMATWYEAPAKDMHVFARTKGGAPATYYYRRFENERHWTPWEKVELDITGDHLLAFKRNNRLCLAWPVFSELVNPVQQSVIPDATPGEVVTNEPPKRKLKIQLAISEYTHKKWQPKKVSQDAILTPSEFQSDASYFDTQRYSLLYLEPADQIVIFSSFWIRGEQYYKNGVFDITGCKGYPELRVEDTQHLPNLQEYPDFFPDFKDTELKSQRYNELPDISPDDLAVRNVFSGNAFLELLGKTPGKFRVSYPHQSTQMDALWLLYGQVMWGLSRNPKKEQHPLAKMPYGTLLPYFKEDSEHAYVIIPGFYKKEKNPNSRQGDLFTDAEKRTASDVFKLLEDIKNWAKKIIVEITNAVPALDANTVLDFIIADGGFQELMLALSKYDILHPVLSYLSGKMNNKDFNSRLDQQGLVYGEQFKNLYHPLVCALRGSLYNKGVTGLMKRETQMQETGFNFANHYAPNEQLIPRAYRRSADGTLAASYPVEDIDFSSDGSYSTYNWDLFFRVPLHIAGSLTRAQRFEEAMQWFHYMFNPTGALPGTDVQKYWVTKPFYLNGAADYVAQRIDNLLYATADAANPAIEELNFAISEWRNKPFRPDVIARFRPVAYQKALLMKYLDNLIEWGDYLFRQDTMESVAQATQLYVLADKLLGPKPRVVPPAVKAPYKTYNQIARKLDGFGNALIALENILPDLDVLPQGGAELPPPPVTLSGLYFCVPANEKMAEYWDRIADRLFKIRHCQNIEGTERSLALFAPPIDPAMLVRAAASGLSLAAIVGGLNAPAPHYRFNVLSQKATELTQEVRGLGGALLAALEKRDAEAMALLRSSMEQKMLQALRSVKELQIAESEEQITILNLTKKVTEERHRYYSEIEKISSKEQLNLEKLNKAFGYQLSAQVVQALGGALALIPDSIIGVAGFGGTPHGTVKWGGFNLSSAARSAADVLNVLSSIQSFQATMAATLGGYERRFSDWKLQERLARKELASMEQQLSAAAIRKELAEADLKNHELQIENAAKTDAFMRAKFTNQELYDWMIGQVSGVYFKAYQLAHEFAKKAERAYRFELGNDDSFIAYGYWDSLKKGLQSADGLIHDIKRMEGAYLDKNKREFELTRHISVAQLDPLALIRLRATGVCDIDIPEALYDMDHPGQYFRRLKSVSISLPCIAGPYTSVSAKLSLISNRYRKSAAPDSAAGTGYSEDPGNDNRFTYNVGAVQSIATSSGQADSGMFELNFRDERYLPFEGAGAISSWRLELPSEVRQFNYDTLSDVIIHVKYTAKEGGSGLRTGANSVLKEALQAVRQGLGENGLHVALHLKRDLPNEWVLLKKEGTVDLTIGKSRLPYMAQSLDTAEIENVMLLAKAKDNPALFTVQVNGGNMDLSRVDDLQLAKGISTAVDLDTPFTLSLPNGAEAELEDLVLVVKYRF